MKKLISSIICLGLSASLIGTAAFASPYYDGEQASEAISSINSITTVMQGDPDGSMREDEPLTRAEMSAIICRLASYDSLDAADAVKISFSDISGSFAKDNILSLAQRGIVNGYEDGAFRPENNITLVEYLTVLYRVYAYEKQAETQETDTRIWDNGEFIPEEYITRGDAAVLTSKLLTLELSNGETLKDVFAKRVGGAPTVTSEPAPTIDPNSQNAFAFKMNAEITKNENYMFSPLSIKTALAMTANGADGATRSEILSALGISDLDKFNSDTKALMEKYNGDFDMDRYTELSEKLMNGELTDAEYEEYSELMREYNSGKSAQLNIANSIWLNEDYYPNSDVKFSSGFESTIKDFYGGESQIVNNKNAVKTINDWVSNKTNNKITSIVDDPNFLAYLVNAVYFKAAWQNEFNEYATEKAVFNNYDGSTAETDFMNKTAYYGLYEDDSVKMISIPYKGSASMYISIDDGGNIDYDSYFDRLETGYVNLFLPKFKIEYENNIGKSADDCMLKRLGINTAFNPSLADFGKMIENVPGGENVYIDIVKHKTYISVDEQGTEAAAVTGVGMAGASAIIPEPVDFIVDKSFTFMIRDDESGDILFMGRYSKVD